MRRLLLAQSLVIGVLSLALAPMAGGTVVPAATEAAGPLTGITIVLDPGHQLGNHNYPKPTRRLVPAGGFQKACNTTGTATNGGYPEATLTFAVARKVQSRLENLGARVIMTRSTNRQDQWGPCVDDRGRRGNRVEADLKLSIHGDGHDGGGRGFHVIAPTDRRPWTHDIHAGSRNLALDVRAALRARGVPRANYTAGNDGLDFRSDLATLNLSNIPTVMVELGNMRSIADARRMRTRAGRATYAGALVAASRAFLSRSGPGPASRRAAGWTPLRRWSR